jgi:hypothetical protein
MGGLYSCPSNAQNIRRIMPEPGKLIFFPSYFFHQTVPLSGTARRISIALTSFRQNGGNELSSVSFTCRILPV